nr:MAG TPA: hypothetical protein [Caudoviricetes sp.]
MPLTKNIPKTQENRSSDLRVEDFTASKAGHTKPFRKREKISTECKWRGEAR